MKTQLNFECRSTDSRPAHFHRSSFNGRARVARSLVQLAFGVLLLCALATTSVANCNSVKGCDPEEEVTIAYKGIMCAFVPYSITLNGTVANGPGDSCVGISANTPKTFTKLKLNKTYQMTAGYAICITTINFQVPEGYLLYIDGQESNQIVKSDFLGHVYSGDGTWNIVVRKKCCRAKQAGVASPQRGSVIWESDMGVLTDGRSAESLSIREKALSASTYTPAALIYSPPGLSDVDVVNAGDGSLRQVKAPQALADVVVVNASEYDVRYYHPADVGTKVNGLYGVTGQPFVTWKIRNPDPSSTNRLQIQKIEDGAVVDQSEYSWEAVTDSWTLSSGWTPGSGSYARVESSWVSHPAQNLRTVINTLKDSSGQLASKSARTYQTFPWGEELVQEIKDPEVSVLTTTYAYYTNAAEDWTYGQIKSITKADGSWEKYEYNYQDWSVSVVLRPWKDISLDAATPENSRATIYHYARHDGYQLFGYYKFIDGIQEQVDGKIVRNKAITRWSAVNGEPITINGEPVVREEERQYASDSLSQAKTTTRYYMTATPFLANRIAEVEYEDGRKDTYNYEKGNYTPNSDPALSQFTPDSNGLAERETVTHGTIASPQGLAFKTTRETLVHDQHSNEVLREMYVYTGTGYDRVIWVVSTFNDGAQLTQTNDQSGQVSSITWHGDHKMSEVDADGVETTFTYDVLDRIKTRTKTGIAAGAGFPSQTDVVTTFSYDADGRIKEEAVSGGSLTLTNLTAFDRGGRVKSKTDQAGATTTFTYANSGRTQTVIHPGGATEITARFIDGRVKSITGTSLVVQYFDYGVNADGSQYTQEFAGNSGPSSPRWTKTTTDWLGRTVKLEKPGFTGTTQIHNSFYNNKGQLESQTTMAGTNKVLSDTRFEYDELGNQTRSGGDVDASGTLTLASPDRINDTDTSYEKIGSDWFRVTSHRTYLTDNNDTPTIETRRERLNNFALNGTEQTVSEITVTDIAGNSTKTTITIDRAAKKQTTISDTPNSNINAVSVKVNRLLQSSTPTTAQSATTYTYDSLGRQTSVTDPATGSTTRSYSTTTGQITSTNVGAGTVSFEYYPATHINAGRLKAQTNAAGKKNYFSYNNRGELIQTWGDATYPIEYIYDAYGQRTELHTFRGGQNWTGSVWPAASTGTADVTSWIYQESTGLITQKQDATLKGATYTYDELGRLKTRVWARSITCSYGYDANTGELRNISYSDSTPAVALTYDRGGRQINVTDAAGTHTRTFNVAGQMQTEQMAGGFLDGISINVGYDSFLRRNSLQTSQGANTLSSQSYGYDSTSRMQTINSDGQTATYAYYPNSGLLNTTSFTGGTNIARSYDPQGRLQNITTTPAAAAPQSYAYTYNDLNQRTRATREDGSYWLYIYNDRGELVSGKKYWSDNAAVWGVQRAYNFDNIGNRNYAKDGGNQLGNLRQSNYTANSLNQYSARSVPGAVDVTGTSNTAATVSVNNQPTVRKGDYFYNELAVDNSTGSAYPQINVVGALNNFGAGGEDAVSEKGGRVFVPQASETFSYDFDGNLTSDGRWAYTWDGENRLVAMQAAAGVPVEAKNKLEFDYDYIGRRIQKKVYVWNVPTSSYQLQSVAKFVYDGWNLVAEMDGTNQPVRSYVWGADVSGTLQGAGGVGGLVLIGQAGVSYQIGYDGGGNVATIVNSANGSISAVYEYDPFGKTVKSVGDYAGQNPFKFSTKYTDAETNLVYYGYRYYQPQLGKWISRDPGEEDGGINLFGFVSNDPIGKIDPLGLYEIDVHYYLTYFLARNNRCFTEDEARSIGEFNQYTDENPDTSPELGYTFAPGNIGGFPIIPGNFFPGSGGVQVVPDLFARYKNVTYHAFVPDSYEGRGSPELWNIALQKGSYCSMAGLGTYMHYLEDSYSHAGFSDPACGHGCTTLHYPDKTAANPDKALRMAQGVWKALNDFAKQQKCPCEDSWDPAWSRIIRKFAELSGGNILREINEQELRRKAEILGVPKRYSETYK